MKLSFYRLLAAIGVVFLAMSNAANAQDAPCTTEEIKKHFSDHLGDVCYVETSTRGAGTIPNTCPSGKQMQGGLCYDTCRSGYTGAVTMCVPDCPAGFRNDGLYCAKPAAYGRGAGFAWQFGDALNDSGMKSRCEAAHGPGNCEKNGLIFYPKCKTGFVAIGANICSPRCPSGMVDIGVSCQKVTYDRGVGTIPVCAAGLVNDAGLCYPPCPAGQTNGGPVCWAQQCPANFPVQCGAVCARNEDQCGIAQARMVAQPFMALASILGLVATGGSSTWVAPAVTSGEQALVKELRVRNIIADVKSAAKRKSCTVSEEAARTIANGLYDLESFQGVTDVVAKMDPTALGTILDAYDKPQCKDLP